MELKLIHRDGWDVLIKDDFIYYQIQDKRGENREYIKTDLVKSLEISEKEFNEIKFGKNYRKYIDLIGTNKDCTVIKDDGSIICCGYRDYYFFFIDNNGNITEKRENIGFDSIYSFDLDTNGNIWYAIPTADYIGQYSLKEEKEIYHLGEKYENGKPLSCPEDIKIYDGFVYISDMNNNQLIKLNIETKEWNVYLKFDENIWEYRQFKGVEIIRLKSGIYSIGK
jgi:hypothetical protein